MRDLAHLRFPAADFESGLIVTPYGMSMRVIAESCSWIYHPEVLSDMQKAIAEQLRAVEFRDRSQSLRHWFA